MEDTVRELREGTEEDAQGAELCGNKTTGEVPEEDGEGGRAVDGGSTEGSGQDEGGGGGEEEAGGGTGGAGEEEISIHTPLSIGTMG